MISVSSLLAVWFPVETIFFDINPISLERDNNEQLN